MGLSIGTSQVIMHGIRLMNLEEHLLRQLLWSREMFGPGERREGIIDHITKELKEVQEEGDPAEWVDLVILSFDGLLRKLRHDGWSPEYTAKYACSLLRDKQAKNENRKWPDWRTANPGKAIEHIKGIHD